MTGAFTLAFLLYDRDNYSCFFTVYHYSPGTAFFGVKSEMSRPLLRAFESLSFPIVC